MREGALRPAWSTLAQRVGDGITAVTGSGSEKGRVQSPLRGMGKLSAWSSALRPGMLQVHLPVWGAGGGIYAL